MGCPWADPTRPDHCAVVSRPLALWDPPSRLSADSQSDWLPWHKNGAELFVDSSMEKDAVCQTMTDCTRKTVFMETPVP